MTKKGGSLVGAGGLLADQGRPSLHLRSGTDRPTTARRPVTFTPASSRSDLDDLGDVAAFWVDGDSYLPTKEFPLQGAPLRPARGAAVTTSCIPVSMTTLGSLISSCWPTSGARPPPASSNERRHDFPSTGFGRAGYDR